MYNSETREGILEAATKLFLQKGYDGVSIKDITEAVQLTKGALYHHFPSKEALFGEVAGRMFSAFATDYGALPKRSLRDFYRGAVGMRQELLAYHRRYDALDAGGQVNYLRILWDAMAVFQAQAREEMVKRDAREREAWLVMVRQAQAWGEIRSDLTAEMIAELFIVVGHGDSLRSLMHNQGSELPQRQQAHWDALYDTLKV